MDSAGEVKGSYTYNAWGELISSSGDMADINPLRYRGYYYDEDLDFYYLHTRYYDPVICRFVGPDDNISTGQGIIGNNMFAYCGNNPVSRSDDNGDFWHLVAGGIIGGIIGGVTAAATGENIYIGIASGAASGALTASGAGLIGQIFGGATIAMGSNFVSQVSKIATGDQSRFSIGSLLLDTTVGAACGLISGPGASSVSAGAGGGKQMVELGIGTVRRTWNAIVHKGARAGITEFEKAAQYYFKSTSKVTINLIGRKSFRVWTSAAVSNGYSLGKAMFS